MGLHGLSPQRPYSALAFLPPALPRWRWDHRGSGNGALDAVIGPAGGAVLWGAACAWRAIGRSRMKFLDWRGSVAGAVLGLMCVAATVAWAGGAGFGDDDDENADEGPSYFGFV